LRSERFLQPGGLLLKCLRRADEFRDVRAELLKRWNFATAKLIPMPLMDSEQLDKEYHRVVSRSAMFIAPLGNGLGELLVEVGLFVGRPRITSRVRASR